MSHIECCTHDTSVDGKGTSFFLDQKLCYQMFVSIYVNVCVCVCNRVYVGNYSHNAQDE